MPYTILYIGVLDWDLNKTDPHAEDIEKYVKSLNSEARFVHFYPVTEGYFIEINADNNSEEGPECVIVADGERIPAESINSVWYRWGVGCRKISEDEDLHTCIAKDFAWREWWSVVRSLESYLSHARWMNPLSSTGIVDCKPYQLFLAQEVGLTVPKTTITNNPEAVSKMFDKADNGRVVFKTLTRLFIPPDKQVLTREIQRDFTTLSRISITKCPAIYQELVERRSDLRITVVGDKVFPVRIDSQALDEERDRLDWRRCQEKEHLYTKVELPESFTDKLLQFHKRAGLVFAAYDFLERGDEFIFLESNTDLSAWLWLEEFVGINVSENMARYLLGME